MNLFLSGVMLLAGVFQCGCSTAARSRPPLQVFYEQAKKRCRTGDLHSDISLAGLRFAEGTASNVVKGPKWDESSIIVTDAAGSSAEAVQVIVYPRVSGSFLDPREPSEEFLREQAQATEEALRRHRYTGVFRIQNPASN
jgi:hypothetical protein